MKKIIAGVLLTSSILIPMSASIADDMKQYQLTEVAKEIKAKDLSRQILLSDDYDLSDESKIFQGAYQYRFDKITDVQEAYSDLKKDLSSELNAYNLAFNYWLVNQQEQLYKESLAKAKNDLALINKKKDAGVSSELEVTQAKMNVNKADADYQDALKSLNQLKYQFNQDLDNKMTDAFKVNFEDFKELSPEAYDPEVIAAKVKVNHPALNTPKETLSTYKFILNQAKTGNLEVNASAFAQYRNASHAADIYANNAEKEFQVYYTDKVAEMENQVQELKDGIEMLSYSYAEQFDRLSNKIALYEDNIKYAEDIYEKTRTSYQVGLKTESDINGARINVLQSELALAAAQKEYSALKEEFRLFQEGYMKQQ